MKVVVIGAGAAGLGIGWRLAQAGAEVTVLDRAQPGRGATWAAAGMISVAGEVGGAEDEEAKFSRHASALWPSFARELEDVSGINIGYRKSGALMVALNGEDSSWLPSGELVREIAPAELARLEPAVTSAFQRALWAPDEAQVDNRAVGVALAKALTNAGGTLVTNESAVRFELLNGKAALVQTPFHRFQADAFVLAAGAWSGQLKGLPADAVPPVRPIKGEMIALENVAKLAHVIRGAHVYLVPRGDQIAVGATVEDVGFDTGLTAAASSSLRAQASALVPSLAHAAGLDHWAGLRPGTPDALPILGPTSVEGLYAATGQFRNGILFAPAIAELLCRLVLGRAEVPAAFNPRRFASTRKP